MRIAEVAFPVPLHKGFHYEVPASLRLEPGMRVRAPFGPRRLSGMLLSVFEGQPDRPLKSLEAAIDREPALTREMLDCALWMAKRYSAPIGECVKAMLPAFVKDLSEPSEWAKPAARAPRAAFELTPGQRGAVESLEAKLRGRAPATVLLYGVPASGKTEVYLRLIRQAVAQGGQALFLLPEISLTQPFFEEFSSSLDAPVVLWHSKLGARERRKAWLGLRRGEIKVVVGARSAALLPFVDLRLAVVDEEQDESFKQEGQSPLYHARELAVERARRFGAIAVLGSATPSLEAWELARKGTAILLRMPERISALPPPIVSVAATPAWGECLSEELLGKLKDRLSRREQSILLVNRRGHSTLVMCYKCGWVDRCPDCGVAKIQHQTPDGGFQLRCHHCERKGPMPEQCPTCKNAGLRVSGIGTQKVVAEIRRALPGARVLRMDSDTISAERKQDQKIYQKFLAREADILVGTKLVAKSFHFPEVTFVGVVDADTMLNMPDFRSSERTMQLLAQVAGRSGRAGKSGEVLLQTLRPDHLAIEKAVAGDYAAFADAELELRKELSYPPFSTLLRLVWAGPDEPAVAEAARGGAETLRFMLALPGHEIVGPAPALLRFAAKKFRYHLLIKVPHEGVENALVQVRSAKPPHGIRLKVAVDPYDFL